MSWVPAVVRRPKAVSTCGAAPHLQMSFPSAFSRTMLDSEMKGQLAAYLERLRRPIQLTATYDSSPASTQLRSLLADIAEASEKVTVQEDASYERAPSFAIHEPGAKARVRFAGLPLGHEFTSLVLALLHVGGHPPKIGEETLAQVAALDDEFHFEVFFSQSCQSCPDVVQALNILAAKNPKVTHLAIDGTLFQEEVTAREVMAVPTVFLNGKRFGQGRMELEEILAKIDVGASERRARELSDKRDFDILVVGGGPAGAAAAVYAARKGIRTGIVTDRFGGQVADTLGIENYISVLKTEGPALVAAMESHVQEYDVDVIKHERALRLVPGQPLQIQLESGARLRSRSVILATGARWRDMGVAGEAEYRNRGVTYCPHCDGPLFKGKRVAVVGGGNSGVEAAIDLSGLASHVTLLEFATELKADAVLQRSLARLKNVEVVCDAATQAVLGDGKQVTGLRFENRLNKELREIEVAGVFVQIGLLPNTSWLKDTLELSKLGEIVVDAHGATSVPGVFAAGDVTTVPFKQIIVAAGDGAKAALASFEHLMRSSGDV